MKTNGDCKFPYFIVGLALGAIGGLSSALLGRRETRELLRERGRNSLDYLHHQAAKLREGADAIVTRGKRFVGPHGDLVKTDTESERQVHEENRREHLGG